MEIGQEQIDLDFVNSVYLGFCDEAKAAHPFLEELYSTVPRTVCDNCGQCCTLNEEEFVAGYVTMFPLYAIEYLNIVRFVRARFPESLQQQLFGAMAEHPKRCPFRDTEKRGCIIYPVRPLICRTYGILREEDIQRALDYADGVPVTWLNAFADIERMTFCPHVRVVERHKMDKYLYRKARFSYVWELERSSEGVHLLDTERQKVFLELTGVEKITRWTWGGYSRIVFCPLECMEKDLATHWPSFKFVQRVRVKES